MNKNLPKRSTIDQDQLFNSRNYGLKKPDINFLGGLTSEVSNHQMPITSSSKLVEQTIRNPEIDDYGESKKLELQNDSEKVDSFERLNEPETEKRLENDDEDFKHVKKLKEVSIISSKPKERNKALDPISEQQIHAPRRIVRPMRDVSIIVRNRHHPVVITRHFTPYPWIPRGHHHKHHHPPVHPVHPPMMPKHKPCKPCKPKVHKKHHHKPKKPKKKPKEHCHHHHPKPKKPHHKKLIYYAPVPATMNYYNANRAPSRMIEPNNNNYAVEESLENEDVEDETEKPFHQEVEDDVEEHRIAELNEPFDDDDPAESTIKVFDKL